MTNSSFQNSFFLLENFVLVKRKWSLNSSQFHEFYPFLWLFTRIVRNSYVTNMGVYLHNLSCHISACSLPRSLLYLRVDKTTLTSTVHSLWLPMTKDDARSLFCCLQTKLEQNLRNFSTLKRHKSLSSKSSGKCRYWSLVLPRDNRWDGIWNCSTFERLEIQQKPKPHREPHRVQRHFQFRVPLFIPQDRIEIFQINIRLAFIHGVVPWYGAWTEFQQLQTVVCRLNVKYNFRNLATWWFAFWQIRSRLKLWQKQQVLDNNSTYRSGHVIGPHLKNSKRPQNSQYKPFGNRLPTVCKPCISSVKRCWFRFLMISTEKVMINLNGQVGDQLCDHYGMRLISERDLMVFVEELSLIQM